MPSLDELNGRIKTLEDAPSGGGGGGGSSVTGTLSVTTAGSIEHQQSVAAVGVTSAMKVSLQLAVHADTDENDATMLDIRSTSAAAGSGTITVQLSFGEPTSGPIFFNYIAS